jgi:hypothetical protein
MKTTRLREIAEEHLLLAIDRSASPATSTTDALTSIAASLLLLGDALTRVLTDIRWETFTK